MLSGTGSLPNISPNFTTSQTVANKINATGGGGVDLGTYYGTTPTQAGTSTVSASVPSIAWWVLGILGLGGLYLAFKKRGS
jgi:hypothetical protein